MRAGCEFQQRCLPDACHSCGGRRPETRGVFSGHGTSTSCGLFLKPPVSKSPENTPLAPHRLVPVDRIPDSEQFVAPQWLAQAGESDGAPCRTVSVRDDAPKRTGRYSQRVLEGAPSLYAGSPIRRLFHHWCKQRCWNSQLAVSHGGRHNGGKRNQWNRIPGPILPGKLL
jgi:hypothetical protein